MVPKVIKDPSPKIFPNLSQHTLWLVKEVVTIFAHSLDDEGDEDDEVTGKCAADYNAEQPNRTRATSNNIENYIENYIEEECGDEEQGGEAGTCCS